MQDHHTIDAVGRDRMHTLVPELVVEGVFDESVGGNDAYRKKPQLGTRKVIALTMFNERHLQPRRPVGHGPNGAWRRD